MTQEDKELLLKDLCARLPYGVKVLCLRDFNHDWYNLEMVDIGDDEVYVTTYEPYTNRYVEIETIKPYLFPLSSMSEEQKNECFKGTPLEIDKYGSIAVKDDLYGGSLYTDLEIYLEVIVWLLKNHFDYRGLIPKGLAIDATGKNIY